MITDRNCLMSWREGYEQGRQDLIKKIGDNLALHPTDEKYYLLHKISWQKLKAKVKGGKNEGH